VAEEIVVLATVEEIAKADKVVVDGVAHKAAAIQNQRATVALRAASKKQQVNAVIVAEVVTAR
jgi:imidazoleglycerol phosphate synthase glutamine amidotransferase subunit HisH